MQGVGISSTEELFLMASALKDNGSTSRWRKIRQRILERDQFTCQICGIPLTTFWQEVQAVTIMNQTFNVFVLGVIHQKAALTVQTLKQAHFLAAQGHP
jgi:hypothetical protein